MAKSRTWRVVALLVALAVHPTEVRGQLIGEPRRPLTGYALSSWVDRDGLAIGPITALEQDRDGYLWLGSETGLLRFDGVRFVTAETLGYGTLPHLPVRALHVSQDQAVWVGFGDGGGVQLVRGNKVESLGHDLPRVSVNAIVEEPSGLVWVASDRGLYGYVGGRWHRTPVLTSRPDAPVATVYLDPSGVLWVGTAAGLFRRTANEHFEQVENVEGPVRGIAKDSRGRLWVTSPASGLRQVGGSPVRTREHEGVGGSLFADRRRNLWLGTRGQGLWRIRHAGDGSAPRVEMATVDTGLVSDGIWEVLEDREGNIWFGTQVGLSRLTPHAVTPVTGIGLLRSVESTPDGVVWAGTASGLIRISGESTDAVPQAAALTRTEVTALHRDATGTLWVATSQGLSRLNGRRLIPVSLGDAPSIRHVQSMADDRRGGLWLVDSVQGLLRWTSAGVEPFERPSQAAEAQIDFVYTDRSGHLWVAFQSGRLGIVEPDGTFRLVGDLDGLRVGTHTAINAIAEDHDGTVWIGGNGGLTRYSDARFSTVAQASGLPGRRVTAITADDRGYLWLGIDRAIVRVRPVDLANTALRRDRPVAHLRFDGARGVAGVAIATRNEGIAHGADGGLWFVTGRGLTRVDPRDIEQRAPLVDQRVRIESVTANDVRLPATGDLLVPGGTARLRIDYTALQLTSPTQTRFRYRLDGFDTDWIDAGTRRQAFYTNLPPRRYRFQVEATSEQSPVTSRAALWSFAIEPTFTQTPWFYVACLIPLGLATWSTWQLHLRKVRREFALVLAERARLSREIHDTLLQNLAGVAIQCAGIENALERSSPAAAPLVSVRRRVEESLRELRQAVWDLRAPVLETHDLAGALRAVGKSATSGTTMRLDVTVRGAPRRYPSTVENEVLRVGQESIANAVRHADATRIQVDLRFDPAGLTLKVSDNGRGLDGAHAPSAPQGQFGLLGMRERAERLRGRLRVGPGSLGGTEVELIVPASSAPAEA